MEAVQKPIFPTPSL